MNFTKDVLKKNFPKFFALLKAIKFLASPNSYFKTTGLLESYERGYPCDLDGSPLPWMTYPMIDLLQSRLQKKFKLFEYGTGYSTIFFLNLVDRVVSVEYSKIWYEQIRQRIIPRDNAKLIYQEYQENGEYCNLVNQQNETYDVIVIDGRDRVRCAINGYKALSEQGVIIFDDTNRIKYQEAINFLLDKEFKKLDFRGLKPTGIELRQTSIFYRENNCLNI